MVGHDGQKGAAAVKEERGALLTASWRVRVGVSGDLERRHSQMGGAIG